MVSITALFGLRGETHLRSRTLLLVTGVSTSLWLAFTGIMFRQLPSQYVQESYTRAIRRAKRDGIRILNSPFIPPPIVPLCSTSKRMHGYWPSDEGKQSMTATLPRPLFPFDTRTSGVQLAAVVGWFGSGNHEHRSELRWECKCRGTSAGVNVRMLCGCVFVLIYFPIRLTAVG